MFGQARPGPPRTCSLTAASYVCVCVCAMWLQEEADYAKLGDDRVRLQLESIFLFSLTWSVGGTGASIQNRRDFDVFIRQAVACTLPEYTSPSGEQ